MNATAIITPMDLPEELRRERSDTAHLILGLVCSHYWYRHLKERSFKSFAYIGPFTGHGDNDAVWLEIINVSQNKPYFTGLIRVYGRSEVEVIDLLNQSGKLMTLEFFSGTWWPMAVGSMSSMNPTGLLKDKPQPYDAWRKLKPTVSTTNGPAPDAASDGSGAK